MSELTERILQDDKMQQALEPPKKPPNEGVTDGVAPWPLLTNSKGETRKIRANLTKILTYYDQALAGLFIYNEATHNIEIIEDRQVGAYRLKKGIYDDTATVQIASYISTAYLLDFSPSDIANEVQAVAVSKSYHPIKDFLRDSLENKADRDPFEIIRNYLNIEDSAYNRLALDLFFRGAIARVLTPGIQFDYCLDLVGQQGARKTSFLRQIFMNWYTDQINSFNNRDDLGLMIQAWGVNDDELEASKKMTFGGLKKAITVTVVTFRPPYGRASISAPVDFVFSRTTNERGHLGDATGDRRFLTVEVSKPTREHRKQITPEDLRDIWGNYYASYLKNDRLYYDDEDPENELIEAEREKYRRIDDTIELVQWYLETPIPDDFYKPSTESYQRRSYYRDLQSTGKAYKTSYDQERRREWLGTVTRDRVAVTDLVSELFHETKQDQKLKTKIRLYFDNLPGWQYRKSIKLGSRVVAGYKKDD